MKFRRPDLCWLVFCISALLFFWAGSRKALYDARDFVPVYSGARCLFSGCNPYNASQLEQQYLQSGGRGGELPAWNRQIPVYPPSALLVVSPLALLGFPAACLLWFLLNGCLYVMAAGLMLSLCPRPQRWFATILVSLILGTSRVLLLTGQPAVFTISLLIIGYYLFVRGRYLPLGAFVLMLSLAVKPQIGGLIVLYLFARGIHRRYAVTAMAGALALLLSAGLLLSLHHGSAGWASDLGANISASLKAGAINDPRPANVDATADTNLQAITSIFIADEREFNAAAYTVFLLLALALIMAVVRTNAGWEMNYLSVGALSALTLMPVYHRYYDARMLLITIPAVAIVYQKRRLLGAMIAVVTVLIAIPFQNRAQLFLLDHAMWQSVAQHKFLFILLLRQQNLGLPILFGLYMAAIFTIRVAGAASNGECTMLSLDTA